MYVFLFFPVYIWLRELAQGKGYGRKREGSDLVVQMIRKAFRIIYSCGSI